MTKYKNGKSKSTHPVAVSDWPKPQSSGWTLEEEFADFIARGNAAQAAVDAALATGSKSAPRLRR